MQADKKILKLSEAVQALHLRVKNNENIAGEPMYGFLCSWGCPPFYGRIIEAGSHQTDCLWNYYLECPKCFYQNNLAKHFLNGGNHSAAAICNCAAETI